MKVTKVIELFKLFAKCPQCGSDTVGPLEEMLKIDTNTFERSCKCGWNTRIEMREDSVSA
jgi:hypothetical protein